jgi:hypothetical protein
MKFRIDWPEYYDREGPQEILALDGSVIDSKKLIGMRIIGVTEDNFYGLIIEVEE